MVELRAVSLELSTDDHIIEYPGHEIYPERPRLSVNFGQLHLTGANPEAFRHYARALWKAAALTEQSLAKLKEEADANL